MFIEALRESLRYPVIWVAGAAFAAFEAGRLVLALGGDEFFAPRLLVLGTLVLPFLLAGVYGTLREADPSFRRFLAAGVAGYFRVLLPGLVAAFAGALAALVVFVPLSLITGTTAPGLAAPAVLAVMLAVGIVFVFYDTAACFEDRGVFASLRRSAELVAARPGATLAFVLTIVAVLAVTGFALSVAWTAVLFDRLEPLATMTPEELAALGSGGFTAMAGPDGIALGAICYGLFVMLSFVLATTYKARVFRALADETPAEAQGVYDEKGRWYRY